AGILRHAEENRAALDLVVAPGFVEAENRIGAEARDGEVGEGKLRARIASGAHAGVLGHSIVDDSGAGGGVGREELNVADDLGDARFLVRRSGGNGEACAEQSGEAARENLRCGIHFGKSSWWKHPE